MKKEQYLSKENSAKKVKNWEKELFRYHHHWNEFQLAETAVLIIDMQHYFLDEKSHAFVPSSPFIVQNLQKIIAFCRRKKVPLLFSFLAVPEYEKNTMTTWWKDIIYKGSRQSRIVKELKPKTGEITIEKQTHSAFYKTDLEQVLQKKKIKNLVITGVLTNLCCETTAREAFIRNFNVFMVIDGTAAYTEAMHLASLHNLAYGFATPFSTKTLLAKNDI